MEELEKGKLKAKRKITALDFTGKDAAVALVSKDTGGPANGVAQVLCLKAANFSDEFLEKMSTVRVELSIPDFLERFFKLEEDDSKFLAALMGYKEDPVEEANESAMDYQKWIEENTESFEVIKALSETDNHAEVLSKLDEETYLQFLQDQQRFEKGLKKLEAEKQAELAKAEYERKKPKVKKAFNEEQVARDALQKQGATAPIKSPTVEKSTVVETPIASGEGGVVNPVVKQTKKESTMTNKVTTVEVVQDVEMIEKSQFEAIQKQFQEQQEQLQKALATVEKFEQERKEQIEKQRLADLEAAVKNKEHAAVLHKALKQAEQAEFTDVVKALAAISLQAEQNDLFVEKSAQVEEKGADTESAVARLIKAKFQSK